MQQLKKFSVFLIALLLLFCFGITGLAKVETKVTESTVTIELDFGKDFSNTEVGYEIIKPGVSFEDMISDSKASVLETFMTVGQIKTNADGKATVIFKPKAISGVYKINAGRKTNMLTGSFEFISKEEVLNLVKELSGFGENDTDKVKALFEAADEGKFAGYELLLLDETEAYKLFEDAKICNADIKEDIYKIIVNNSEKTKTEGTLDEIQKSVGSLFEQAVYQSLIINTEDEALAEKILTEQAEKTKISESEIFAEVYKNEELCDKAVKEKVIENLIKRNWTEEEKKNFEQEIEEIIFLTAISENSVYGNIGKIIDLSEKLLTDNGADWEMYQDVSNKQAIYREIAGIEINSDGSRFDSIEEFAELLNELSDDEDEGSSGGGGGSSGGGKGGSSKTVSLGGNIAAVTPITQINKADKFIDLKSAEWAIDAVSYLASKDILNGRSETEFAPNDNMKREELAKVLVLAFGLSGKTEADFSDADQNAWYYEFIMKASASGIMNGYGDVFGVGDFITREDLATICFRIAEDKFSSAKEQEINFTDEAEISDYAKEAVKVLSSNGIINGVGDGSFNPKAFATRAECAKIIYQTILIKEAE